MTEQDWLKHPSLSQMLSHLASTKQLISSRKFRLLGCAICRLYWERVKDPRSRLAVEVVERFVDGQARCKDMQAAHLEAAKVRGAQGRTLAAVAAYASQARPSLGNPTSVPHRVQCQLLCELVGNPFRKVKIARAWLRWRERTVCRLAQAAFEKRDANGLLERDRLAILADALEESGCTSADLLGHLRGPGPHVQGCWVLDLLLDKK